MRKFRENYLEFRENFAEFIGNFANLLIKNNFVRISCFAKFLTCCFAATTCNGCTVATKTMTARPLLRSLFCFGWLRLMAFEIPSAPILAHFLLSLKSFNWAVISIIRKFGSGFILYCTAKKNRHTLRNTDHCKR